MATNLTRANFPWPSGDSWAAAAESDYALPTASVEQAFRAILTMERSRAERSGNPFILMLLDAHHENGAARTILFDAVKVVESTARETDVLGWYKDGSIIGVIFTELGKEACDLASEILRAKIRTSLQEQLGEETAGKIAISMHVFPEKWDRNRPTLVPDLKR